MDGDLEEEEANHVIPICPMFSAFAADNLVVTLLAVPYRMRKYNNFKQVHCNKVSLIRKIIVKMLVTTKLFKMRCNLG